LRSSAALLLILALAFLPTAAAGAAERSGDLTELSLEQLMALEVTSVSKKPERRSAAAAAVYVITEEDIRRSGVTTIPDALRLAPGVQVARIDANKWAIGVRGFGSRLSRSVLVLIDGRSVYTPLFAGTYWEVQDTLLEDIDRIEVIRGPGGALWGANAVNGVINIITKHAKDTQGGLLSAGGGNEEQGFGGVRWGGALGERFHYRFYGKYFNRDGGFNPDGRVYDDWRMSREGFRADWDVTARDAVNLQGDVYDGDTGQQTAITELSPPSMRTVTGDAELSGGNLLARWRRDLGDHGEIALQTWYDNTFRRELNFHERRNTFDLDFQHHVRLAGRHDVVWGFEYRSSGDRTGAVPTVRFVPRNRRDDLFTWFAQNEVALLEDRLYLTLGSKFEHNDYSGYEFQPSGRLLWTPNRQHAFWGSVARAVRTPSRVEHDLQAEVLIPPGPDTIARLIGDQAFVSEKVIAYEVGYRVQPMSRLFLDLALFYNQYQDLLSIEPGAPFDEPADGATRSVLPLFIRNRLHGDAYGFELAADAVVTEWWRLHGAYSLLNLELRRDPGSHDTSHQPLEESSPHNQVTLRSTINLPASADFDGVLRYVDNLPAQHVGSYVTLDLRFAKRVTENVELSVVGLNLAQNHHREFAGGTEVERSIYGQVRWRW
jgi:iron complex outermembrane receptor protein